MASDRPPIPARKAEVLPRPQDLEQRIRDHDWSATSLGPAEAWPQPLRTVLSMCLGAPLATAVLWGPDCRILYNDAYAIMGNLELLQNRIACGRLENVDRYVNAAQGAGRRAASLTQRLLAFSRRQTLDPKPTDVDRLIGGMEELLRRTVGSTTDIEVVGAAGLWTALIDAVQLESALLSVRSGPTSRCCSSPATRRTLPSATAISNLAWSS